MNDFDLEVHRLAELVRQTGVYLPIKCCRNNNAHLSYTNHAEWDKTASKIIRDVNTIATQSIDIVLGSEQEDIPESDFCESPSLMDIDLFNEEEEAENVIHPTQPVDSGMDEIELQPTSSDHTTLQHKDHKESHTMPTNHQDSSSEEEEEQMVKKKNNLFSFDSQQSQTSSVTNTPPKSLQTGSIIDFITSDLKY